ncbi:Phosphoenolpyruvate/pyruvate domain-containing protein [Eremomyces bilateralis CBS 781.70]|uniref:Phosphoenolpyruvate/pyruvate domain-containing protein n=1 Tax=Eremomyces bilateralis CBS 781.70 TaxID=1392243 RepID=A0A6G1GHI1_9PEZI|nr:Phosphoenolpyruvate/pyruvate domain-containing protein [Eremomyces bilateralis CBS 781.70]KAF1817513.1 Phosphoenolpyruvate/pyruvate domain-containing protein [Eremomyces bilateralis CBS 781.70]
MASINTASLATHFKSLHKPSQPLLVMNVWDGASAMVLSSIPTTTALATASYAVAKAAGLDDKDLTLEDNLRAASVVATVSKSREGGPLPVTVDLQDGYGSFLEEAVDKLIDMGVVVGINLEDFMTARDGAEGRFYTVEEQCGRIKKALDTAEARGVGDFVVNARADPLLHKGSLEEVITRGKKYLEAGATTCFVLGALKKDIPSLVKEFGGRVNVGMKTEEGSLAPKELADLGVARISVGPGMQMVAMNAILEVTKKAYTNLEEINM